MTKRSNNSLMQFETQMLKICLLGILYYTHMCRGEEQKFDMMKLERANNCRLEHSPTLTKLSCDLGGKTGRKPQDISYLKNFEAPNSSSLAPSLHTNLPCISWAIAALDAKLTQILHWLSSLFEGGFTQGKFNPDALAAEKKDSASAFARLAASGGCSCSCGACWVKLGEGFMSVKLAAKAAAYSGSSSSSSTMLSAKLTEAAAGADGKLAAKAAARLALPIFSFSPSVFCGEEAMVVFDFSTSAFFAAL